MNMRVPVYTPSLRGNEKRYVMECLDTTWISSKGPFVTRFEDAFAQYIGAEYCTSVSNGTTALHLGLVALGLGPGDEVIVPTLTYIASVNTIAQTGATPVFVDSLRSTWQLNPEDVIRKITPRTRAVMAVHLYGHSCHMAAIADICHAHDLLLIEDCAEAVGTRFGDKHVGTFGDVATFSFFGNKTITTGEGGMVVSRSDKVHGLAKHLKSQGMSADRPYWHDMPGFNYRMTNICAAIGLAQLEQVDIFLARKRELAMRYQEQLSQLPLTFQSETVGTRHSFWMCSIVLDDAEQRDPLRRHLAALGIETRPVFYPAHIMPMYREEREYPVAEWISAHGISLPSWPEMPAAVTDEICESIRKFFRA